MTGLVVFDLFGTLIDDRAPAVSPADLAAAIRLAGAGPAAAQALAALAYPLIVNDFFGTEGAQRDLRVIFADALAGTGLTYLAPRLDEISWQLLGPAGRQMTVAPDAEAALCALRAAGYALRLLSSTLMSPTMTDRLLKHFDLLEFFEQRFYSSAGGPRKPQAGAFRQAAGPYRDPVMVGDSEEIDLAPARRLGWQALRRRPGQSLLAAVGPLIGQPVRREVEVADV